MPPERLRFVIACALIFLLNVALNLPLFLPGESPYRDTIEGGYQGMSRFIAAHPGVWGWNPLQYCGIPTQYMYVPLLPYSAAALSGVTGMSPAYAYKLLTATAACLGPVALLGFVFFFTRSLAWSVATALGFSLFSPLYGLIRQLDRDRGMAYLPWRMHVLAKYGEGPHISGVTLLLPALVALWKAATESGYWRVPLAAILLAAVCLTNWVAALALAVCVLLMAISASRAENFGWGRFIGAGLLAYGLACFWLTPGFIATIAFNWPADAYDYKLQAAQNWLFVGWALGLAAARALAGALGWTYYRTLVGLGVFAFGYPVLIYYAWGVDMLPESRRYAIEFGLFLTLALWEFFRWGLTSTNRVRQVCAATVMVALAISALPQAWIYISQGYARWRPVPPENTSEYRIARWLEAQQPRGRILASGGLRFRLNSWFDLPQVGGAFESGVRNRHPLHFAYQIRTGLGSRPVDEAAESLLQMQALGAEYVVIHGPEAAEHYRDYRNPMKFEGVLPKVFSDSGTWVYRVPFNGLAHLVRPDEQPPEAHRHRLGAYVAALGDKTRPSLDVRWAGASEFEVTGRVPEGYTVTAAITYDTGWEARQDGSLIALAPNALGFLVARPKPAETTAIRFRYRGTPEQRGMAVLSLFVWTGTAAFLWKRWRRSATR